MNSFKQCGCFAACAIFVLSLASCSSSTERKSTSGNTPVAKVVTELKKDKNVNEYAVSHDGKKIVVTKTTGKQDKNNTFNVMNAADGKEQKVTIPDADDMPMHGIRWSYNDQYFSIDTGTSAMKATYVFDASTKKLRLELGNTSMVWKADGNAAAFTVPNPSVPQITPTELDGADEVDAYDIETLQKKRLF